MAQDMTLQAIQVMQQGGIVIYPTDTAFGIGCRIDDYAAVDRLFTLRRRPISQAMPVLVSSMEMANLYYDSPSDIVRRLMKTYWPGALTIAAKCHKDLIYSPIRGGGDTVGLRMPNHEVALKIIKAVGVPILGPSANFHGDPTPYRFEDIDPELAKLVDFVVPGICLVKQASTVVDCTDQPYAILRQGAVKLI
ncbi:MAG: L-threonylcarbamoyladenylate synthase [Patescibacteria group bacterium]